MNVICVDDERYALLAAEHELKKIAEITEINLFLIPEEALSYIISHQVDVVLLDIDMGEMNGLMLARKIREQSPSTHVIFLTGYSEFAVDTFQLHISGYLLKPVTHKDLEAKISYIKNPPGYSKGKRVKIQCFGNFEIFVDGIPLKFNRSKTKELLAYLTDQKGAAATTGQLCAVLWEDKPDSFSLRNQLRTLLSDLTRCLKLVHIEDIFIKKRNYFAISVEAVDCDYYSFLRCDANAVNSYAGEYMTQYSWAEMTLGKLSR